MTGNPTVLRGTGIRKTFALGRGVAPGLQVLRGVDIEVRQGEVVFIVGASGSGKSTLLHILGGMDKPDEGRVWWGEREILSLPDDELAALRGMAVGFVFQFHHLLPEFSALENVIIPQAIQGVSFGDAAKRARELLAAVSVADRADHRPSELSGGEQQRVAIARALANRPQVVLADEPTGNLDSENSRQLHDLIFDLNRNQGQAFVIVTHNEQFVSGSSRVLRMADGVLR